MNRIKQLAQVFTWSYLAYPRHHNRSASLSM